MKVMEEERGSTHISIKEEEVLRHMAGGLSTKEISQVMHKETGTIETWRKRLFRKLGAKNGPHAIYLAIKARILKP